MMAVPVAVLTGACGAMVGMVLTDQRLPRRAHRHRPRRPDCAGDRRRHRQRPALRGPRKRQRHNHSHRCSAPAGWSAHGDGGCPDHPREPVSDDPNWVSVLGWQGGLANDRGIFIDHLEKVGPGHYRSTQPMPVSGSVEDAAAGTRRQDLYRRPDLPGRRSGHRREGSARRGVDDAAVRRGDHHPAAGAQP